jgi:hypothetical protein
MIDGLLGPILPCIEVKIFSDWASLLVEAWRSRRPTTEDSL